MLRAFVYTTIHLIVAASDTRQPSTFFRIYTPETVDCAEQGIVLKINKSGENTSYTYDTSDECYAANNNQLDTGLASHKTVLFAHGFTDNSAEIEFVNAGQRIARAGYNAIMIDWSHNARNELGLRDMFYAKRGAFRCRRGKGGGQFAKMPSYKRASSIGIVDASADITEFITFLRETHKIDYIHLTGFSLGAQLAGRVGQQLVKQGNPIDHLTGLDPAPGGFYEESNTSEDHLDTSDAKFVEIIHSNAGCRGVSIDIGHVDFWIGQANDVDLNNQLPLLCRQNFKRGGMIKTALGWLAFTTFTDSSFFGRYRDFSKDATSSCAHHLSVELFVSSYDKCTRVKTDDNTLPSLGKNSATHMSRLTSNPESWYLHLGPHQMKWTEQTGWTEHENTAFCAVGGQRRKRS